VTGVLLPAGDQELRPPEPPRGLRGEHESRRGRQTGKLKPGGAGREGEGGRDRDSLFTLFLFFTSTCIHACTHTCTHKCTHTLQDKLSSLKSSLEKEQAGACPFSPTVIPRRPAARVPGEKSKSRTAGGVVVGTKNSGKADLPPPPPAYERLTGRGAEYRRAQEARNEVNI
jgi:hypothetical protein